MTQTIPIAAALAAAAARLGAPQRYAIAILLEDRDQRGDWFYTVGTDEPGDPKLRLTEDEFVAWSRDRLGPPYVIKIEYDPARPHWLEMVER